jgi:hypothetical protein
MSKEIQQEPQIEIKTNTDDTNQVLPDIPVPAQYGVLILVLLVILKAFVSPFLVRVRNYISEPEYDNQEIVSLLNQLLALSKSDRTAVVMFHNGEKYANGSHYWKLTMSHEAVKAGVARISRQFRAIPVTHLIDFITKVRESDSLTHIEANAKYDSVFADYLADAGAEAVITYLIKDSDNKEIALLFIYYTHSTPSQAALKDISESEESNRILTLIKKEITSAKQNNSFIVLLSYALKVLGY